MLNSDRTTLPASKWSDEQIEAYCAESAEELAAIKEIEFAEKQIPLETIFQMREYSGSEAVSSEVSVIDHRPGELFDYYLVASGQKVYEVIRFGFFAKCSCPAFEYKHYCLKHVPLTLPRVCRKCFEKEVKKRGDLCAGCEMKVAPYLKNSVERKAEMVGGIRIN